MAENDDFNLNQLLLSMIPTVAESPIASYILLNYDDNDIEIKRKELITAYDKRVYNAISTLYLNERKTVSLSEIYSIMDGYIKTNPSKSQLESIEKSLRKMGGIDAYIHLTDKKNRKTVTTSKMIDFSMLIIISEKGNVFKSIEITGEPPILTYNKIKNTLLTIPIEYNQKREKE